MITSAVRRNYTLSPPLPLSSYSNQGQQHSYNKQSMYQRRLPPSTLSGFEVNSRGLSAVRVEVGREGGREGGSLINYMA